MILADNMTMLLSRTGDTCRRQRAFACSVELAKVGPAVLLPGCRCASSCCTCSEGACSEAAGRASCWASAASASFCTTCGQYTGHMLYPKSNPAHKPPTCPAQQPCQASTLYTAKGVCMKHGPECFRACTAGGCSRDMHIRCAGASQGLTADSSSSSYVAAAH